jgi:chromosome partitioning protein
MTAQILAFANASGSAGKTTSAVSLAVLLAEAGKKVVVVDADAQANATAWLGIQPDEAPTTLADVLMRRATLDQALIATTVEGVSLVPANRSLDAVAIELNSVVAREMRLRRALEGVEADVVLIDCPGAISILTIGALVAADALITVTQPTMKEVEGVPEMLDTLADVQEAYNPGIAFAGIIPCIMPPANQGKVYRDVMGLLEKYYPGKITPAVRRSSLVATAYGRKIPLPVWAPKDQVTTDYRDVLGWLTESGVL